MAASINQHSRLRFGTLVTVDGYEFWDTLQLDSIPLQPDDIRYTVRSTDRLDLLAHRYYRSVALKWVIMVANDMELDPSDLDEGTVIRIPSPRYVLQELFTSARNR